MELFTFLLPHFPSSLSVPRLAIFPPSFHQLKEHNNRNFGPANRELAERDRERSCLSSPIFCAIAPNRVRNRKSRIVAIIILVMITVPSSFSLFPTSTIERGRELSELSRALISSRAWRFIQLAELRGTSEMNFSPSCLPIFSFFFFSFFLSFFLSVSLCFSPRQICIFAHSGGRGTSRVHGSV